MFQVAPSIGNTAMAQFHSVKSTKGLSEGFRHRQERTAMRTQMMQGVPGQAVTREPSVFIKRAAEHTPMTMKKSRR